MNTRSRTATFLATSAAVLALAGVASAQDQGLPVQQFVPAPGGDNNFMTVAGSNSLGHTHQSFGLYLNYARHPLVLRSTVTDDSVAVIANQLQADVLVAVGLLDLFELGVGVPVTLFQNSGDSGTLPTPDVAAVAAGDIRLYPRWTILPAGDTGFGLALLAEVTLPSGDPNSLQGNASVTVEPALAAELRFAPGMRLSANLGYLVRQQQTFRNIDVGNEFTWGAAYQHPLVPNRWHLIAEVYGKTSADPDIQTINIEEVPLEAALGLRWNVNANNTVTFGVGPGLTEGYGSPQIRAIAGYAYTEHLIPDSDGDGLLDNVDACPFDPEDFDEYADQDGCPDPDDDGDGICDPWVTERNVLPQVQDVCVGTDQCRTDPEDKDDFEDDNGCPDPDNDQDGVLDVADACILIPEDRDGHEDADGCPDPDNDHDAVCDPWVTELGQQETYRNLCAGSDACVDNPEDPDGVDDLDGCPEPDNDHDEICDPWAAMWIKQHGEVPHFKGACIGSDQCPNEPETLNDVEDEDGCPDKSKRKVEIAGEKLLIKDTIYFDFNKATIKSRSFPILNDVAKVLYENPQIQLVEIQGHTDDVGNDAYNLKLSQQRADSVMTWLSTTAKYKISPERLRAKGFGEEVPLVPVLDADGKKVILSGKALTTARDSNRRVEFLIVNRGQTALGKEQ